MEGCRDGRMKGWKDRRIEGGGLNGWKDTVERWKVERMDGLMDGRMEGGKYG